MFKNILVEKLLENYSDAHKLAQRNAALPIEKGGLGLHPENTAHDRAKAMGYHTKLYRGTPYPEDSSLKVRRVDNGEYGIFASSSPHVASKYAMATGRHNVRDSKTFSPKVIPIMAKIENPIETDYNGKDKKGNELSNMLHHVKYDDINGEYSHDAVIAKNLVDDPHNNEYGVSSDIYSLLKPKNIRSIHAAFDPMKKDSDDILS